MRKIQKKLPSIHLSPKLHARLLRSLPEEKRTEEAVLDLLQQIVLQALDKYERLLDAEARIIDEVLQNHIHLHVENYAEALIQTKQEVFPDERRDSFTL